MPILEEGWVDFEPEQMDSLKTPANSEDALSDSYMSIESEESGNEMVNID